MLLFARALREFDDPEVAPQVTLETTTEGDSGWARLAWLRRGLPRRLRALRPDVLLALGNLAPALPVTPQVVFCQQSQGAACRGGGRIALAQHCACDSCDFTFFGGRGSASP